MPKTKTQSLSPKRGTERSRSREKMQKSFSEEKQQKKTVPLSNKIGVTSFKKKSLKEIKTVIENLVMSMKVKKDDPYSVLFVINDLMADETLDMSAVVHKGSRGKDFTYGKLLNMQMPAMAYEAEDFDDDLTDGFYANKICKFTKRSLIIIMRRSCGNNVMQTLAATVRDWIQEKACC